MKKRKLTVNVLLALLLVSGCTASKQFDAFLYGSSKPSLNTNTLDTASIETIAAPSGEEAATSATKPAKTFKATVIDVVSSSTKSVTGSTAAIWTPVVDATTSATKPATKTTAATGTTVATRTSTTDTTTSATKPATGTTAATGTTVVTRTPVTDTTTSATKPATGTTAVTGTLAAGANTSSTDQTVESKEVEYEQESSKEPEEQEEEEEDD